MTFLSCVPNFKEPWAKSACISWDKIEVLMDRSSKLRLLAVSILLIGFVYLGLSYDLQDTLQRALTWIRDLGPIGPLVFAGIYVIAAVAMVPGSILTLGAGVIFGVLEGTIVVAVSATLGATAPFLIGRYVARDWVASRFEKSEKFRAIDKGVAEKGWKIVGLTRLSPVFPFNLLNYIFGITSVSLRDYVLASFFGMLPATLMYVYIGSLAGDLAALGSGDRARTPGELVLYAVGLAATIVVTVFVTRIARKALNQRIQ